MIRCSHTARDGRQCTRESHEFGKHTFEKKWVVYFKGPQNLQDKIIGQVTETRMREILAGAGLQYSQPEIERIIASGEFDALFNVSFVQHPAGI